ncbi:MAG: FAD:protein FMN transferase [Lachnospiraceae bacterium]|nr:FAD:protein FMN transferase [Lachnospiraceae bacterium]
MIKKYLKYTALFVLFVITVWVALMLRYVYKEETADTSFFAMDTYMSVKVTGKNPEKAVEAVRDAIMALDSNLSVTNPESLVYRLNADGSCTADDNMIYLLEKSAEARQMSGGAFNICIYPIMKEWGFTGDEFKVPDDATLKTLCEALKTAEVSFSGAGEPVNLSIGTMIDFGGIAKGYASKVAGDILSDKHIKSALINLGGNVYAIGKKADGSLWNVAVNSPDDSHQYLGILSLANKAVITSGGYERFFEEAGVTYHHIIDPSTGYPANSGAKSVTIVSEDPTLADALSTAIFVMGLDKATDLWRENAKVFDFIFYDDNGNLYITEGVKDVFSSEITFKVIEK